MPRLFISYRQEISKTSASSLFNRLGHTYGAKNVFFDQQPNRTEDDWREKMLKGVHHCDVFLCLIEGCWISLTRDGERRLDQALDPVRREIEAALKEKAVIPILVDGTAMPPEAQLPACLHPLAYRVGLPYSIASTEDEYSVIVRRIDAEYGKGVRINRLRRQLLILFALAAMLLGYTAYLQKRLWSAESIEGVVAGLARHDNVAFDQERDEISSNGTQLKSAGSQALVGIARVFPTRQRLNENAPLPRYVQSTLHTFDFFAVHGSILVSLQDTIVERANHGVRFRVLLMDHGDANVHNLAEYGRVQFPTSTVERLQEMPGESIDVLKSIRQRIDKKSGGSFEFRFVPFQFLNSFWIRDVGYPSALGHLEITAYRPTNPNITNPSVRFGALSPEMIESLQLQFEGLWSLGKEQQSSMSTK